MEIVVSVVAVFVIIVIVFLSPWLSNRRIRQLSIEDFAAPTDAPYGYADIETACLSAVEDSTEKLDLVTLQQEHEVWRKKNFPNSKFWHPVLGLIEEVGELCHAVLKRDQGIRGDIAVHNAEIDDAVGDILIYLVDFCNREGISLQFAVEDAWSEVKKRDWVASPNDGVAK